MPSNDKIKEVKDKMVETKSKRVESAEEGRRSSVDLRSTWAKGLKKGKGKGKGQNTGKGKGKRKVKGKGKSMNKYQVNKDESAIREEAIDKLEKNLEKKRRSSIKDIEKMDKSLQLKKAVFKKVKDVDPEAKNFNIMMKCINCKEVDGLKVWEAVCGDETGVVTLSLHTKEQADLCTPGASVRIQNAKVIMVKGHIRLAIDKWAVIKIADAPLDVQVNTENDRSATEYELVDAKP